MSASGESVTLSGQAPGAPPGSSVQLASSPYPYTSSAPLATVTTGQDGSFSYTAHPDRNTRYTATVAGDAPAAVAV